MAPSSPPPPPGHGLGTANRVTKAFIKMLRDLPDDIQKLAESRYKLFLKDPSHGSFQKKPVQDKKKTPHRDGSWSVRVSICYRAIFVIVDGANVWYWIGAHSAYNTFVGCKKK